MADEVKQNLNPAEQKSCYLSVSAVISMALGLFFCVPVISGLFAIIIGVIALYGIAMHKDELKGRGLAVAGIILGLMQFLLAILLLSVILFAMIFGAIGSPPHRIRPLESYPKRDYGGMVGASEFNSYNEKGISFKAAGKHKEALQAYRAALDTARKEAGIAYYGIGYSYMDLGQYDKALTEFDKAIEYNQNLYDAYQNKAVTYRLMGRYQDSVDACKQTIARFPDFARAYCSMGWAYEYLGRYKEAIGAHLEAIRLEPGWQFPRKRIEYCFMMLEDRQLRFEAEGKIKQIEKEKHISK